MIPVNINKRGKYNNAKTGIFKPLNPNKYNGQVPIVFKSQLEYLAMRYLDSNPSIMSWSYESQSIKYFDKIRNKVRRYFIDFVAIAKIGNVKKTIWLEIKSKDETKPPKNKKNTDALSTYVTNMCKWESASKLAKSKGYQFQILTEEQLKL